MKTRQLRALLSVARHDPLRPQRWPVVACLALATLGAGCGAARTVTVTDRATVPEAATTSEAPGGANQFSGTGTKLLPPLSFSAETTAEWSNTGDVFLLIVLKSSNPTVEGQIISSRQTQGSSYIPPGSYEFKVSTWSDSNWTLDFR